MSAQLETLSGRLKQARNRLAEHRHGGIVLTGDELENTIATFNEFARLAREMESELDRLDRAEQSRKLQGQLRMLLTGPSAEVLDAMRAGDGKVVLLPRRRPSSDASPNIR